MAAPTVRLPPAPSLSVAMFVALSGCVKSEVSQRLLAGDFAGAKETAVRYQVLFGKDRYFIELMDHDLPVQRLKRLFAVMLYAIAAYMAWGAVR